MMRFCNHSICNTRIDFQDQYQDMSMSQYLPNHHQRHPYVRLYQTRGNPLKAVSESSAFREMKYHTNVFTYLQATLRSLPAKHFFDLLRIHRSYTGYQNLCPFRLRPSQRSASFLGYLPPLINIAVVPLDEAQSLHFSVAVLQNHYKSQTREVCRVNRHFECGMSGHDVRYRDDRCFDSLRFQRGDDQTVGQGGEEELSNFVLFSWIAFEIAWLNDDLHAKNNPMSFAGAGILMRKQLNTSVS